MFQGWASAARRLFEGVLPLYRDTNFAYTIAAVMAGAAALLVLAAIAAHIIRVIAIEGRIREISGFISFQVNDKSDADERERQFASRFPEIDQALSRGSTFSWSLAHAWRRYRKTLLLAGAPPIRSTERPSEYLYSATPPPTWLGFAASMFVAFGLLATFLGLVAALTFAAGGVASENVSAMQQALRDLLSAAASKFVTSVSGVALSIILRLTERVLIADLRSRVDRLSRALEFGIRIDKEAYSAALAEQVGALVSRLDKTTLATAANGADAGDPVAHRDMS